MPLTCSRLREWVKIAQPNARLTYAQGSASVSQCCRPELRDLAWELAEKGYLSPHFIRGKGGEPNRHIVQRSHRKYVKGVEL